MKWKKKRIREFADVYDGPHATPKESTTGAVFLGIKNIKPEGGIDLSEIRHISDSELEKWTKRVTPTKDDIVLSYEATLHRYAIIPDNFIGCLGRRMALVRVNKDEVNHKFLYYTFLSDAWRGFIDANKLTGATVDRISIKDFPDYPINLPPLATQHRIASILSAYDDLIENNLKRIKLLEEKAFLSYKGIVNSEKLEELTIEELAKVVMGQSPTSDTYNEENDGLPFHQGVTNFSNYFVEHKIYCKKPIKIAEEGDILFSVRAPVGRINFTNDKICIGRGLCAFRSKKGFQNYFYHQLKEFFFTEDVIGNGAIFNAVTKVELMNVKLKTPSEKVQSEFEKEAQMIYNLILNLSKQNAKLREARDILLPRLMRGEIEV